MPKSKGLPRKLKHQRAPGVIALLLEKELDRKTLIAKARREGVSGADVKNFLTRGMDEGTVSLIRYGLHRSYRMTHSPSEVKPVYLGYPDWLEPKGLPDFTKRLASIEGVVVIKDIRRKKDDTVNC